jgi:hypothetical protein
MKMSRWDIFFYTCWILIAGMFMGVFIAHTQEAKPKATPIVQAWTKADSKAYANDQLLEWQQNQYQCLVKLWTKESNWRTEAYNKQKVMGKNAGGIPQLLGLDPKTPATLQIDRGLSYIMYRYGTPCMAWKFFQRHNYY